MKNYFLEFLIDRYQVITFDVFDTLICRTVDKPSDIFKLTGKSVFGESKDFCDARKLAELEARKKTVTGEVTLDEIYESLDKSYLNKKNILKQTEIEWELKCCRIKKEMQPYFTKAINSGKQVYLISDMYLSQTIIEQMLKKCKIEGYIKLYVSNEYNANKVTGELFNKVIKENNIPKKYMLHIGDSIKADFIGAHLTGIKPFLIKRKGRFWGK